jgi:phosphatidylserine decarboxylase
MKHSGRARKAAFKLIIFSFIAGFVIWALLFVGSIAAAVLATIFVPVLLVVWIAFTIFTLYFFRDPNARAPMGAGLVLAPGHGKVDAIDATTEPLFMGGEAQRVSIFLSVIDVHVQNAPVSGKVAFFKYTTGQFLNALRTESATFNENVLIGIEASEPPGQKIGVRLIAGVIARRIVPFVQAGEQITRGDRISLIQFGSRADVYLPAGFKIKVKLGDHVVGGETILAAFE